MSKNVVMCLWYSNSRKVAFALLLFVVATALAVTKVISATDWMLCVASCVTLIGGGTLADSWMGKTKGTNDLPPQAQ